MHPRSLLAMLLIALGASSAHSKSLMFSVKNCTASRWRLSDSTPPPWAHDRIRTLGAAADAGAQWSLAPGETMTFQADMDPLLDERIVLKVGPESPLAAPAGSEFTLAAPVQTLEDGSRVHEVSPSIHQLAIVGSGHLLPLEEALSVQATEIAAGAGASTGSAAGASTGSAAGASMGSSAAASTGSSAVASTGSAAGVSMAPGPRPGQKRGRPRRVVSVGVDGVAKAKPKTKGRVVGTGYDHLKVRNRSRKSWTLRLVSDTPIEVAFRHWMSEGTMGEGKLTHKHRQGKDQFITLLQIGAKTEVELPLVRQAGDGPKKWLWSRATLQDDLGSNPYGASVRFLKPSGDDPVPDLHFIRRPEGLAPERFLTLRENVLEILEEGWPTRPSPFPEGAPPVPGADIASPPPGPSPRPLPLSPLAAEAAPRPLLLDSPPEPSSLPRLPLPALPEADSKALLLPVGPSGVAWTGLHLKLLRLDLGHGAMFLGVDEGKLLGQRLGLNPRIFTTFTAGTSEEWLDDAGRILIDASSQFQDDAPADNALDRPVLLYRNRHYTLLQPTPPGALPTYGTPDGATYVEMTVSRRDASGAETMTALIPADGHCLVTSLHFLRHGVLPTREEIRAHRLAVAERLSEETLRQMAEELARDILQAPRRLLPTGNFEGLGPAFSEALVDLPDFMSRHEVAVTWECLELINQGS